MNNSTILDAGFVFGTDPYCTREIVLIVLIVLLLVLNGKDPDPPNKDNRRDKTQDEIDQDQRTLDIILSIG